MVALDFESVLARRIARKDNGWKGWLTYMGAAITVFLIVNLTSGSLAAPHAVIHIGSQNSMAKYMGQFDGKANVIMLGVLSANDWICVKLPFKGHLSDIESISYSEFVCQPDGQEALEPYTVIRMNEGRDLVCHPEDSYSTGEWKLPVFEWQSRDIVAKGFWSLAPTEADSLLQPLSEWISVMGDGNVLSINLYVGAWDVSSPYQCYVGDLSVNGVSSRLSNAGRCTGPTAELPTGF